MIAALLALATAVAGPCADTRTGLPAGPVLAPLRDGALGHARAACTRSEVAVGVDGRAIVDLANFYGYLPGALTVDGQAQVAKDFSLFARLEAVRLDLALASFTSTGLGLGHTRLGAAWGKDVGEHLAVGAHVSAVLPTATALYRGNPSMGLDLGVSLLHRATRAVDLHAHVVHHVSFGTGVGPRDPVGGNDLTFGFEARAVRQFGVAVDLNAATSTRGFDFLAPALALRFSDGRRFGFELGLRAPLVGDARELAALTLRASARLGPRAVAEEG